MLLVVGVVLLVFCVVLWIVVWAYVAPQDSKETGGRHTVAEMIVPLHLSSSDPCDSAYQSTRDALAISAHIFSDVAFLVMMVAVITIVLAAQDFCK